MKLTAEWDHSEETEWSLETWTTDLNDVRLTISYFGYGDESFTWCNNLTGKNYRIGWADTLEAAMLNAMDSATERNN